MLAGPDWLGAEPERSSGCTRLQQPWTWGAVPKPLCSGEKEGAAGGSRRLPKSRHSLIHAAASASTLCPHHPALALEGVGTGWGWAVVQDETHGGEPPWVVVLGTVLGTVTGRTCPSPLLVSAGQHPAPLLTSLQGGGQQNL